MTPEDRIAQLYPQALDIKQKIPKIISFDRLENKLYNIILRLLNVALSDRDETTRFWKETAVDHFKELPQRPSGD
jgi:hypothetical protein